MSAATAGLAMGLFAKNSVQAAVDFNAAMTRVAAVTNTPAAAIGAMTEQVKELSAVTGKPVEELANALYYLASAGLDAAQVMPALEATAKASAVGLGDMTEISRTLAQALNLYSDSGLTAAKVTDVLFATVRESVIAPEELAGSLGRVLPIAKEAGLSFEAVAASIGAMGNAGLDAYMATTALRGLLQSLVAPTRQTTDELHRLGLTTNDVRDSLEQNGLVDTLRMLWDATGHNIDAMRELVPNVRALTGALNLTEQDAAKVDAMFGRIKDSTGDLSAAFAITAASPAFQFQQAMNDIRNVGIDLATQVLPTLVSVLQFLADNFNALLTAVVAIVGVKLSQTFIAWVATAVQAATATEAVTTAEIAEADAATAAASAETALASARTAAAGTQLELFGAQAAATATQTEQMALFNAELYAGTGAYTSIAKTAQVASTAESGFSTGLTAISAAAAPAITQIGILADAYLALQFAMKLASEQGFFESLHPEKMQEFTTLLLTNLPGIQESLSQIGNTANVVSNGLNQSLSSVNTTIDGAIVKWNQVGSAESDAADQTVNLQHAYMEFGKATNQSTEDVQSLAKSIRQDFNESVKKGTLPLKAWQATTAGVLDDFQKRWDDFHNTVVQALGGAGGAMDQFANKNNVDLGKATSSLDKYTQNVNQWFRNLQDIQKRFGDSSRGFVQWASQQGLAQSGLVQAVAEGNKKNVESFISSWNDAQNATDRAATAMADKMVGVLKDIKSLLTQLAKAWDIPIHTKGDKQVKTTLSDISGQLNNVERTYTAHVTADTSSAMNTLGALWSRIGDLIAHPFEVVVHMITTGGSTAFDLLDHLEARLEDFTLEPFQVEVHVAVTNENALNDIHDSLKQITSDLKDEQKAQIEEDHTLKNLIDDITGSGGMSDAWIQQAQDFAMWDKELEHDLTQAENHLDKLTQKAQDFSDTITSAFDAFDLVGGLSDLSDQLKQQQIDALQAQLDAAQSGDVVNQALVDSLNAQIQALQDAVIVPTTEQMSDFLDQQLAQAQAFAAALTQLSSMGLDPTLLQQFAAGGPEELPFMQALIDGGQEVIDQFNATQQAIDAVAQDTAAATTNDAFGKSLAKATKQVDDLQDQFGKFTNQLDRFVQKAELDALSSQAHDVTASLRDLEKELDKINSGGNGGGGGGGGGNGAPGNQAQANGNAMPPPSGPPIEVHVHGSVLTENDLIDSIHAGLLKKSKRNAGVLGLS